MQQHIVQGKQAKFDALNLAAGKLETCITMQASIKENAEARYELAQIRYEQASFLEASEIKTTLLKS